jgi:hypothetical protein
MGYGTGGTFATDAQKIGMSQSDIQELTEKVNFSGDKGVRAYEFKGKKYQVQYENSGGNTTLLSIKPL